GYANDILPKAKGHAAQVKLEAEAYKKEKIQRAYGEASRFLVQLAEYRKAKEVTRKRLYLEAMEEILAGSQKFVLDAEKQGLLPLLPLRSLEGQVPAEKSK
ncbi:MAG: HflK protein, partial [Thermodesulfobacteriota bacterium]